MSNERAKIDDILDQVHSRTPAGPANDAIDDDVNAILESLGMPAKPEKRAVLAPEKPAAVQSRAAQQQAAAPRQAPAQTAPARAQNPAVPAPPRRTGGAHIVNMPPLAAPVVQNETETLELPSIKAYSEMQSRRIAEIERVAAETALSRAAQRQKSSGYAVPGATPRAEVLSVEVDDRFRAFFSKTVANDGTAPPAGDTAELETSRTRRKAPRRKANRLKNALNKAGQDPDEAFLTGEFDAPPLRDNVEAALHDAHAMQNDTIMPQLLDMTGNVDVLGAGDAQTPDYTPYPAASRPAVRTPSGAMDFTVSVVQPQPSDTFLLNHIDERAEEVYDRTDRCDVGTQFYGDGAFESDSAAVDEDYFGDVPPPPSGSTFREITVTMPIGNTTSTMGIDPDK
ncbi:MAG: hypothetical protein RR825_06910, partial [Ruthenibacterium sp.]